MRNHNNIKLSDFGLAKYRDSLVPVNILMVLMGFCILLFNRAVEFWGNSIRVSSVICGSVYMIAYMFYISEYYEKLWEPNFSLPFDKMFFRIYSLIIGVVIITFMHNFPEYWYFYTLFLMLILYVKKNNTRKCFQKAFNVDYPVFDECQDGVLKAKYLLCEDFTVNFLWWGVIFNAVYAIALFILYKNNPSDSVIIYGVEIFFNYYSIVSFTLTIVIVSFWVKKVTSGIALMVEKINKGDYEYFKEHL